MNLGKRMLAEFIGTFALVFIGSLSVDIGGSLDVVAFAHAFTLMVMMLAIGPVSGCHINPAVTIAYLSVKKIPVKDTLGYMAFQLAGAAVAGFLHACITPNSTTSFGLTIPSGVIGRYVSTALAIEAVFTLFLALSVYETVVIRKAPPGFAALVIGLTLGLCIFASGPLTGAALNPARAFGPAVASGNLSTLWLYFVGPIIGAVTGFWIGKTLDKGS